MADKKKTPNDDNGFDFDLGIGKFNLGGLFKGIEKLVDLSNKINEAGGALNKEGEIDLSHLKNGMKGVFGFSIKTASEGKTVVEPFGNIKKTPQGPIIEEDREPIVDVFDEETEIKVYAEMPGVNATDVKLELTGDILEIAAQTGNRKYHKELLLPSKVNQTSMQSSFNNGILEIIILK